MKRKTDKAKAVGANRMICVVDDELDITVLFKDALQSISGITVFTFTDPILALQHFQINESVYVLVITDFRMPGLNGMELINKIKHQNPFVRTILMTAFDVDDKMFNEYTKKKIINAFIQKPIKMHDLLMEVKTQIHAYETQKRFPSGG